MKDFRLIVVNNGDPEQMKYVEQSERLVVLQQKENLGWEKGLKAGLAHSYAPYVLFANDDLVIPTNQKEVLDLIKKER